MGDRAIARLGQTQDVLHVGEIASGLAVSDGSPVLTVVSYRSGMSAMYRSRLGLRGGVARPHPALSFRKATVQDPVQAVPDRPERPRQQVPGFGGKAGNEVAGLDPGLASPRRSTSTRKRRRRSGPCPCGSTYRGYSGLPRAQTQPRQLAMRPWFPFTVWFWQRPDTVPRQSAPQRNLAIALPWETDSVLCPDAFSDVLPLCRRLDCRIRHVGSLPLLVGYSGSRFG